MSFETLKEQLIPGAMVVTRKDRTSNLYSSWSPDETYTPPDGPRKLEPRTVCTMISTSKRHPYDWFYVMANGTLGWLSYWDIAHVEHTNRSG